MAWDGHWARESGVKQFALERPLTVTAAVPAEPPPPALAPPAPPEPAKPRRSRLSPDVLARLQTAHSPKNALVDVVEETAPASGAGDACVPMAHLVERKPKPGGLTATRTDTARRSSILDPMFG
jgi:hypothetical protein